MKTCVSFFVCLNSVTSYTCNGMSACILQHMYSTCIYVGSRTQCIKAMSCYTCCDWMSSETYCGILCTCGILYTYVCSKSVTTYSLALYNVYIRTLYSMYTLLYAYNIFIYLMYTLLLQFLLTVTHD